MTKSLYIPPAALSGGSALAVSDLRTSTYPYRTVSLDVRQGEILGLAGLVGSGRTEFARAIFGIGPCRQGHRGHNHPNKFRVWISAPGAPGDQDDPPRDERQ